MARRAHSTWLVLGLALVVAWGVLGCAISAEPRIPQSLPLSWSTPRQARSTEQLPFLWLPTDAARPSVPEDDPDDEQPEVAPTEEPAVAPAPGPIPPKPAVQTVTAPATQDVALLPPSTRGLSRKSDAIPEGDACLKMLTELGVSFRKAPSRKGIDTPVLVDGPIGGVRYHGLARAPMLCDCRLAVALAWVGPMLLQAGVTDAYYSGAYSYRMSRVGRLSLHAYGLAIDIHELDVQGKRLTLTKDYEQGLEKPCLSGRALNQMACRLRGLGLFREFLTPDSDEAHRDHFHISIKPLAFDPVVRVQPPKPAVAAQGKDKPKTGAKEQTSSPSSAPAKPSKGHDKDDTSTASRVAQSKPSSSRSADGKHQPAPAATVQSGAEHTSKSAKHPVKPAAAERPNDASQRKTNTPSSSRTEAQHLASAKAPADAEGRQHKSTKPAEPATARSGRGQARQASTREADKSSPTGKTDSKPAENRSASATNRAQSEGGNENRKRNEAKSKDNHGSTTHVSGSKPGQTVGKAPSHAASDHREDQSPKATPKPSASRTEATRPSNDTSKAPSGTRRGQETESQGSSKPTAGRTEATKASNDRDKAPSAPERRQETKSQDNEKPAAGRTEATKASNDRSKAPSAPERRREAESQNSKKPAAESKTSPKSADSSPSKPSGKSETKPSDNQERAAAHGSKAKQGGTKRNAPGAEHRNERKASGRRDSASAASRSNDRNKPSEKSSRTRAR